MAFDVSPEPVGRRGRRSPVIAVIAATVGIVALALATSAPAHPAAPTSSTAPAVAVTSPAPTTLAAASSNRSGRSPAPFPSTRGRRLPSTLTCHGVSDAICDAVATASVAILPADVPPVVGVDAWASILCADDLDCPPQRLARSEPLGSAVVSFGGSRQAWVNVVQPSPGAAGDPSGTGPVAWIVRWVP